MEVRSKPLPALKIRGFVSAVSFKRLTAFHTTQC